MKPAPLLRLDQVTVAFGAVNVLDGIDLEVRVGEFVALVGPSGCGKTTLLNVCSGWLSPSTGSVNRPARSPLAARYAWQVWPALNLNTLREASVLLLGRHDFAAFGSDPDQGVNTVRTVSRAEWTQVGEWFYFF